MNDIEKHLAAKRLAAEKEEAVAMRERELEMARIAANEHLPTMPAVPDLKAYDSDCIVQQPSLISKLKLDVPTFRGDPLDWFRIWSPYEARLAHKRVCLIQRRRCYCSDPCRIKIG